MKRSVKNNIRRFPCDFMFELTKEKWDSLRCSFCTLNKARGQHPKYLPFAFTEHGVAQLSSVLMTIAENNSLILRIIQLYVTFVSSKKCLSNRRFVSVQLFELWV
ncbi:ORF6N domain-containing protein [Parabacteroides sp. AM08-6]|uniref:ORF6N domain-containing protein n=1 Tax=Parabacteroides sp. AM08-6 TaxID=2292053 RepID=UPI000F000D67|nr:ORF6N domain-containing protein [Parabacteroides sp. AM08-6]RHJ79999.1 ORF6N domain-containing protein [Parabacteroides sp. AM08-6]